jgi:hypothetical protein
MFFQKYIISIFLIFNLNVLLSTSSRYNRTRLRNTPNWYNKYNNPAILNNNYSIPLNNTMPLNYTIEELYNIIEDLSNTIGELNNTIPLNTSSIDNSSIGNSSSLIISTLIPRANSTSGSGSNSYYNNIIQYDNSSSVEDPVTDLSNESSSNSINKHNFIILIGLCSFTLISIF